MELIKIYQLIIYMAFWDFLNNTKRYVGNIYEGAKRVGNVL